MNELISTISFYYIETHIQICFPPSSFYTPASQAEEESRAKRAFTILCDLHRRRVWFDERTTNAICDACFHPSSRYMLPELFFFSKKNSIGCSQPKMIVITCRIMIAAISFLLGYENAPQEDDSDASSSEDEADQNPQILLSKQDVYKVL